MNFRLDKGLTIAACQQAAVAQWWLFLAGLWFAA
jgi:hypothetical protein